MKKIYFIGVLAFLQLSCNDLGSESDYLKIHNKAVVVDLHSDTVLRMLEGFDFSIADTTGHMDIPRLRQGGVDLQVFACFLSTSTPIEECRPKIDEMIDSLEAQVSRNAPYIGICRTVSEARHLIDENRIAAFIGIENGVAIADNLENLRHYYDRGVRYMTLTHTSSSDWCISSADTAPAFHGLTPFGREVVRTMNELGMIVDISHSAPETVEEVLKITTDPVIASHSCVHALCSHDRNLTDEQIKAIAANGGVIGINFFKGYLSQEFSNLMDSLFDFYGPAFDSVRTLYKDDDSARSAARRELYGNIKSQLAAIKVDVGTVADHIDHIVNLVGSDYVGLGSDFDGVFALPDGLTDCSMVPNITKELVARGYTAADIRKILGGNFMRVFAAVCDN